MLADNYRKTQLAEVSNGASMARLNSFAPAVISAEIGINHPQAEINSLLGSIQHALSDRVCPIVQFVSAYQGEGSGSIAFETALSAARLSGRRTLFININTTPASGYSQLSQRMQVTLEAFFNADHPQASPLVSLQGVPLFYAELGAAGEAVNLAFARSLLGDLREHFDMIVLASEAVISRANPVTLGGLADGTIMIVEAERTRSPVAEQLKLQVESAGGNPLGAVLNRRRFYIPRWVYRLLFGQN